MRQIRFTKEGFEKLQQEYDQLLIERKPAVEEVRKAREMGDLSENGYYKSAKGKLISIDGRLRRISAHLKQAIIITNNRLKTSDVHIGSKVRISDGKKEIIYEIVGDLEASPSEGKISLLSPLGRALDGKKEGDNIEINTPKGEVKYTILNLL